MTDELKDQLEHSNRKGALPPVFASATCIAFLRQWLVSRYLCRTDRRGPVNGEPHHTKGNGSYLLGIVYPQGNKTLVHAYGTQALPRGHRGAGKERKEQIQTAVQKTDDALVFLGHAPHDLSLRCKHAIRPFLHQSLAVIDLYIQVHARRPVHRHPTGYSIFVWG